MSDRQHQAGDDEVALGRSLAETAFLNSPQAKAGRAAIEALRRAAPDGKRPARNRRRFQAAVALLLLAIAALGLALWALEP